jgi:hypothetical protein
MTLLDFTPDVLNRPCIIDIPSHLQVQQLF